MSINEMKKLLEISDAKELMRVVNDAQKYCHIGKWDLKNNAFVFNNPEDMLNYEDL